MTNNDKIITLADMWRQPVNRKDVKEWWESLSLAPKHTDEEYEATLRTISKLTDVCQEFADRIKELEKDNDELTLMVIQRDKEIERKHVCDTCEKLWDADACEWTCPSCVIKYLEGVIRSGDEGAEEMREEIDILRNIAMDGKEYFIKTAKKLNEIKKVLNS